MKLVAMSVCLFAVNALRVCDSGEEAAPQGETQGSASVQAAATAEGKGAAAVDAGLAAKLAALPPRIGGSVVVVGDHAVEFKLHASGQAEALVLNAAGKSVSDGVALSFEAQAEGSARGDAKARPSARLAFVGPRGRFEGRCKGKLAAGPVDLKLEVGGKPATARLDSAVLIRGPELGGSVLVVGDYGAEVFARKDGHVVALLRDRTGAEVTADATLDLRAKLTAAGGATHDVQLRLDPARGLFTGKAEAGVELAPGAIELSLGGKAGARGRLEGLVLSVEASHGGQVLAVGDHSVELVAKGQQVTAFVFDATGAAAARGDLDLNLALGVDGATKLALAWDAPSLSYRGKAAAGLDLNAQPLRLELRAGGKLSVGAAASLAALAKADLGASAGLDGAAAAKLDANVDAAARAKLAGQVKAPAIKAPEVEAKATATAQKAASASGKVKVTAPKVSVEKSASAGTSPKAGASAGGKAKASFGF